MKKLGRSRPTYVFPELCQSVLTRASFSKSNLWGIIVSTLSFCVIQPNSLREASDMVTQMNSPSLLDALPMIIFGVPPKSWWILGANRYWTMEVPGAIVPMAAMVLALILPII